MDAAQSPRASTGEATSALQVLLVSAGVTALLYLIPYGDVIGRPLVLLSTLVHELGHGIAAVLVGGTFHEFVMFPNGSGVASSSGSFSSIGKAIISAGGLVGPAVAAAFGLAAARNAKSAKIFLGVLGVALVVAEILVVRNMFGFFFVAGLALICLFFAFVGGAALSQYVLVFLSVQLALSVYSRGDYLFMKEAHTSKGVMPSDVSQMADALIGPYWMWGAVCALFSALALLVGAFLLLRGGGEKSPA
jgi:hypothetical protein